MISKLISYGTASLERKTSVSAGSGTRSSGEPSPWASKCVIDSVFVVLGLVELKVLTRGAAVARPNVGSLLTVLVLGLAGPGGRGRG